MADAPEPNEKKRLASETWGFPSWKKIGEFVANVLQLERSIENLKRQNEKLEDEITRLQRQVDDQAGQLKVVLSLIDTTLSERAAKSGESAALKVIQQMIELRADRTSGE